MNVAFIPVRGGSKSIPLKNVKMICGKPLVYWSLKAACECQSIDRVYVATDSEIIRSRIELCKKEEKDGGLDKVIVIERSQENATDYASTEKVMLEFASKYNFNNIVLIQATSPLLTGKDLDRGFKVFCEDDTDSVVSVVRQKRFLWKQDNDGLGRSMNYDIFHRPRRQNFEGYLVENGAFYITSRYELLKSQNRVSGNIKLIEMDESSYYELDEPNDWTIVESLLKRRNYLNTNRFPEIKMLLTDCDGCLTDGGMIYSEKGDELKRFNTRDGVGFEILKRHGIITGIITGENVKLIQRRSKKMQVDIYEGRCNNKVEAVKRYCELYGIELCNVCYIGDDINDKEVMEIVGLGCCPSDASECIKRISKYVANVSGGNGIVREVAEIIVNVIDY